MRNHKDESFREMVKLIIKEYSSKSIISVMKTVRDVFSRVRRSIYTISGRLVFNYLNRWKNEGKSERYLEIGPGNERIDDFETLNIVGESNVDYVYDVAKALPFKDNTFDLIYASHILEHIPWYKTEEVLKEWGKILKPGGQLEVWVPDGVKICETLLKAELEGVNLTEKDGWYKFNPRQDPCVWAAGRIFTYGNGTGNPTHPNWHRAIFTPRYLKELFNLTGLVNVREMDHSEVRGYDHGWINLGVKGTKP